MRPASGPVQTLRLARPHTDAHPRQGERIERGLGIARRCRPTRIHRHFRHQQRSEAEMTGSHPKQIVLSAAGEENSSRVLDSLQAAWGLRLGPVLPARRSPKGGDGISEKHASLERLNERPQPADRRPLPFRRILLCLGIFVTAAVFAVVQRATAAEGSMSLATAIENRFPTRTPIDRETPDHFETASFGLG